jgi:hypothetical protein
MPKLKIISLVLTISAFLSAAPQTNNLIFFDAFKMYSGSKTDGDLEASDIFPAFGFELRGEYDYHITDGWKILLGAGLDVKSDGAPTHLLGEIGAKKYFNDKVYAGAAYAFSLGFPKTSLKGSERSPLGASYRYKEKYSVVDYKPNLVLFAGIEIEEDWLLEVRYRNAVYDIFHEYSEYDIYSQARTLKSDDNEEVTATELSFALGLIF